MSKVFLIKRQDLAPGRACKVSAADKTPVAIYNVEGRFYATHDLCTHAEASLAEGEIVDGDCIACPLHDGQFHIPTGQAVSHPCTVDLRTYLVIEDGDDIYADLSQESEEAAAAI